MQTPPTLFNTAPMDYHYGVNLAYNEAEEVHYANRTWLDIGLHKNLVPSK